MFLSVGHQGPREDRFPGTMYTGMLSCVILSASSPFSISLFEDACEKVDYYLSAFGFTHMQCDGTHSEAMFGPHLVPYAYRMDIGAFKVPLAPLNCVAVLLLATCRSVLSSWMTATAPSSGTWRAQSEKEMCWHFWSLREKPGGCDRVSANESRVSSDPRKARETSEITVGFRWRCPAKILGVGGCI